MDGRIFKYKLDFYYKSVIVYMLFLIVYVMINGVFFAKQFSDLYHDPIIYISILFVLYTLFILLKNAVKAKEFIFENDKFIIKNRFGQREILFTDVINLKFSRERKYGGNRKGSIRRVRIKLKDRKRYLRIRLSEFQEEKKLLNEFKNLARIIIAKEKSEHR